MMPWTFRIIVIHDEAAAVYQISSGDKPLAIIDWVMIFRTDPCVWMTPLGLPVDPDV
jgi:hypothetical protein